VRLRPTIEVMGRNCSTRIDATDGSREAGPWLPYRLPRASVAGDVVNLRFGRGFPADSPMGVSETPAVCAYSGRFWPAAVSPAGSSVRRGTGAYHSTRLSLPCRCSVEQPPLAVEAPPPPALTKLPRKPTFSLDGKNSEVAATLLEYRKRRWG
jgi:hypothetical protein